MPRKENSKMKMSYLLIAALLASTFVCDGAQTDNNSVKSEPSTSLRIYSADGSYTVSKPFDTNPTKIYKDYLDFQKGAMDSGLKDQKSSVQGLLEAIGNLLSEPVVALFFLFMIFAFVHAWNSLYNSLTREFPDMSTTKKVAIVTMALCTCLFVANKIGRSLGRRLK